MTTKEAPKLYSLAHTMGKHLQSKFGPANSNIASTLFIPK